MTEKYSLLVGLNDKDTKVQQISTVEAYKILMNIIKPYTDGCTIYEALGYYKHENGDMVQEKSLNIEILYFNGEKEKNRATTKNIVETIKSVLNQESVAVTYSVVDSDLW